MPENNAQEKLPPPWQWPALWSLDLPAIAVLWQTLFARAFAVDLALYHHFTLAGLVWIFLVGERWIYFFKIRPELLRESEDSAKLQLKRGSVLRIGAVVLFALVCIVAIRSAKTSLREVAAILILTSAGGAYLLAIFRQGRSATEFFPREMALAAFVSAAIGVFIWAHAVFAPVKIMLPGLLFLLLLFYYFCLAANWSQSLLPLVQGVSLLDTPLGGFYRTLPLAMIFAGTVLAIAANGLSADPLMLAIGVSAGILALLETWQNDLPRHQARLFADLALLSPLIPILLLY